MSDLTAIHYTCHRIDAAFARNVRRELVKALPADVPIVVVSQNGTTERELAIWEDFGPRVQTMIRTTAAPSIAQVYRNVLAGCQATSSTYVAMTEDDGLYVPEHFAFHPPMDTFCYNEQRWVLSRQLSADGKTRVGHYFFNPRTQLAMGIFSRDLAIETLSERFEKHPQPPEDTTIAKNAGWGEMGRYERNLGLAPRKIARSKWTERPCLTINHSVGLMGRRACRDDMPQCDTLEPWGNATELWRRIVG